ncbi:Acg family FMN-binding oxidoreductase [Nocardioides daeguensis]|uniref:NAD(P)H nitroreductase n=1 Tax=Nocardioides daeguensis TaxID=908359 RepID=A0ABP6UQH9_9ACTN|nr:nitroreductase family protein [Nocardioides daeguensis]MBV6728331.1 nitroreductase family protein [Nocardioides daeguensis]MCR1773140.1 nitroreductase family protein [Nocardioides daeguensis]
MPNRLETRREQAPAAVVERLVSLACLAPSVHNTQPWLWRYDAGVLELHADLGRRLPAEDPRGRNMVISCGAALHHLQFAARALGWETAVERLPDPADQALLARVTVSRTARFGVARGDIDLLRTRCTDRRRFTAWPVPTDRLDDLCRRAELWGARSEAVTSDAARFRLELLANRAISFLEVEGRRLLEQDRWIDREGPDGIPLELLPDDPDPLHARSRFRPGVLEDTRLVIHSGERVIALGGEHDDVAGWLSTGEAMSDLWLEATREGMSVVPMSQPMEVESTRHEIATTVLTGGFEPHLLLRVGWQAIGRRDLPRTPRRPLRDVLQR